MVLPDQDFWRGKRVLLTGHTGFKGSWLALWLHRLGAQVVGLSLPPATAPNLFDLAQVGNSIDHGVCDIRDAAALKKQVEEARPEVVLHLAAQALVRAGYREPVDTFATNVMGTAHLLDALRGLDSVRSVVVVTTDKVYRNNEWTYPYREDDALGGHDPYSASKAAAELVVASYRASFLQAQGVAVATARAGNVIGGGDWAEDRLVPDAVRAWLAGRPLEIRRPEAIRPWQHVLEPLAAYLVLAERLWRAPELAGAYNFGPATHEAATVRTVVQQAQTVFPQGEVLWGDGSQGPHEAGWLALEVAKARTALGVAPRWSLTTSVQRTLDWYRRQGGGADARSLCLADIEAFESAVS
ncbi:CDP-glucose 4,6-dehydratase [Rhodoferax koreense]|uniref:CDP-glucose 4,6-dehydratase n=1 Tax=Rhodoferax koreensis TaxID=1842727 RepID=A0A1P8JSD1_9BURK|nr:CDP-glucose 4,6-dehydratase [Rhodoferax koreense]APW36635.1 CDP-glucose 4,6-dehydratase [Rhodoferax koreense]